MSDKELQNDDLNNISGGNSNLDKYLKTLVGKDEDKMLVDYGTGVALDHDSTVAYEGNNNVYIIKREKCDAEKTSE